MPMMRIRVSKKAVPLRKRSNALILEAAFYENEIAVDSHCCAGVTPKTHNSAIDTMKMCQIIIK